MFKFYVDLIGHDKVTDAGGATTCRQKTPMIRDKRVNMKDLSKTWVLTGKQFEDFRRKKEQKHYSRPFKNPVEQTVPKYNN